MGQLYILLDEMGLDEMVINHVNVLINYDKRENRKP